MNPSKASIGTRLRVGAFTLLGLGLIGYMTVYVNDKPFFWSDCQLKYVNVDDATGLTNKSPVRTLGLDIGYLKSIELRETHVRLGICITAPVEILPTTQAFIRGEGFLGDKFVELKPVRYLGGQPEKQVWNLNWLISEAYAGPPQPAAPKGAEIPVGNQGQDVQQVVDQVNDLVKEMTDLTNGLKKAIDPEDLKNTMNQLNQTLNNASRTLSPEGGLNQTAQRTLSKLEDAIEQLRDQLARVNRGEGSVGRVLNDPEYAEQLRLALVGVNRLLGQVAHIQFIVNLGVENLPAYGGARGWLQLAIWPDPDRYYLLGLSRDPRGARELVRTTTRSGGRSVVTEQEIIRESEILFTGMLGKTFWQNRADVSAGVLHGDGSVSLKWNFGPSWKKDLISYRFDVYSRGRQFLLDARNTIVLKPWSAPSPLTSVYFSAGFENIREVDNKLPLSYGIGLRFSDDDIKLLFALQ